MNKTKKITMSVLATMIAAGIIFLAGCQKDETAPTASTNASTNSESSVMRNQNSIIFPIVSHMYGKSYSEWVASWWKWDLQFDCAHFPTFDADGSLENQNQSGPVFFLAGNRHQATLSVTVPAGKSIFFPLATVESDYPCGDAILDSLASYTQGFVNTITDMSLTIDGQAIGNLSSYQVLSPTFTTAANADLANCFDHCITGSVMQFEAGGYFFMLKPLSAGSHTIVRHAVAVGGAVTYDTVYNITQL